MTRHIRHPALQRGSLIGCLLGGRDAAIERTLKSGEVLFRMGSRTAGLYEVMSGRVRLARVGTTARVCWIKGARE